MKLKSFSFCQLGGHDVCLFSQTPKTSTVHFTSTELLFFSSYTEKETSAYSENQINFYFWGSYRASVPKQNL